MIIEGAPWAKIETLAPDAYDPYWGITLDFLKIAFAHWPQWLAEHGLIDRATRIALLIDDEIKALEGAAPARSDHHRRLDRRQSRHRPPHRGDRARAPRRGRAARPRPRSRRRRLGDDRRGRRRDARARGPSAVAHAPADRRNRRQAGGRREAGLALAGACGALGFPDRSAPSRRVRRSAGASGRARCRRRPSPPRSQASRSSSPTMKPKRRWRWRSRCAKPSRRPARPRPSSRPIRRSRAGCRRSWLDGASRSRIRQGGRWGRARRARSPGSSLTPRSSSRRARFSRSSPTRRRASAAPAPISKARRARWSSPSFAPSRSSPSMTSIGLSSQARQAAEDIHAHPAIHRVGEVDRQAAEALAREVARALAPLRALGPSASLSDCLTLHRAAVSAVVAGPRGAAHDTVEDPRGFEPLMELMDEWSEAAAESFPTALAEYSALFDDALASARAPPASGGHPRLQILGLLEARLLSFDCVLLAGLDETVWPPAVDTDAFLNRPMRAALGLSPPERRIGQTAHDFVAALGAREAVLSRAKKRGGEPTVASRFLQRLVAAAGAGAQAFADAEERGRRYLAFARALDQPAEFRPGVRPAPRPPVELRPRALSVTRIETLRRDPYAIYAEYILRLKPLETVERDMGPREIGIAWHAALQEFVETLPVRRPPARGARSSVFDRPRALCAPSRRSRLRRSELAAYRSGPRLLSRFRPQIAPRYDERLGRAARRNPDPARERRAVQAQRAGRPDRRPRVGRREAHRLQKRDAAGRQGSQGGICAPIDAGGRDAAAGRIQRAAAARSRAGALSQTRRREGRRGEAGRRQRGRYTRARREAFRRAQDRSSTNSPARTPPTSRARSPNSPADSPTTTISRASRNGRRPMATPNQGMRREPAPGDP